MNTPRTIGAALLTIAAISTALLWSSPEEAAPPHHPIATAAPAPAPARRTVTHSTPAPEAALPTAEEGEVVGTGRTAPVVDVEAEDAASRARYMQRIDDNIDHLEAAAAKARAEGNHQRAELMEKRIAGLQRRMQEFDG